jgi:preprotein translocase subunit SecG
MALLATFAIVVQVLSAIGVIVLVLLQHGKGADMGAAFGSGSSGSLFGATGSANFLSRMTAALATVFFVCTLALAFLANSRTTGREPASVMDRPASTAPAAPALPSDVPAPSGAAPAAPTAAPGVDATQKNDAKGDIPK